MKHITVETFDEFTEKHVEGKYKAKLKGVRVPRNNKEFGDITEKMYAVRLSVTCRAYPLNAFSSHPYSCQYEVVELQDDYKKGEIYQLWEKKYGQYDGLKVLLSATFGELSCGGVAGHHYGQTNCDKKTWERVKKWDGEGTNEIKNIKGAIDQHNSLVNIFGFNPFSR